MYLPVLPAGSGPNAIAHAFARLVNALLEGQLVGERPQLDNCAGQSNPAAAGSLRYVVELTRQLVRCARVDVDALGRRHAREEQQYEREFTP